MSDERALLSRRPSATNTGDIQSSVETEPDIERGPLRRPPKRWTKSVILPRT